MFKVGDKVQILKKERWCMASNGVVAYVDGDCSLVEVGNTIKWYANKHLRKIK